MSNEKFPEITKILRREDDKDLVKEAIKEAVNEWLTNQYAAFGKWTATGIAAGLFVLLVKVLVVEGYWPKG